MSKEAREPLYPRIVLGLDGGPTDELVVHVACELATGRQVEVVALHVIAVDWRHDLSEDLASSSEPASGVLDLAEVIAERHGVTMRTELLQARDVAAALVDEAVERGADLLVVGLPYRQRFGGDFALGSTIPYIFQNAACSVMVVREPMTDQSRRAEPQAVSFGSAG